MKIALAQLNYHIGNFRYNVQQVTQAIERGKKEGADLVIFAELAVCGYPPRDFLEFSHFILKCETALAEIAEHCDGISAIIGCPVVNPSKKGKKLFNAAAYLEDKKVKQVVHKALLPNYDIFDEYRYFEPGSRFQTVRCKGLSIALTICEDIWNVEDNPLYKSCPMDELIKEKPQLMINIAASPFSYSHDAERKSTAAKNAVKYNLPFLYLNHVGSQTELIFDGGSLAMDHKGNVIGELKYFEEDFKIFDINISADACTISATEKFPEVNGQPEKAGKIHDALVFGIREYFVKMKLGKAIIGLSGGIDSAVTLCLAAKALGSENVRAVLLPSEFSSAHSVDDAKALCENLKVRSDIISISNIYRSVLDSIGNLFEGIPFNIAEENIQSRSRGMLLMALANKFNYILLNTSNKSELAVGYGTLYGDLAGGLSVLGDVYKTEVYELAAFINKTKIIIPENTILKEPSAELKPDQKDSDSLPDYTILDKILFEYIENFHSPGEIAGKGFDKSTVTKILNMVNTSEYKRYQTPPILRVSPKAFGMGRRLPIVAEYLK